MEKFEDWCGKPEIISTGNGWRVRINGCDVFDRINEFGCKQHRSFDIAQKLGSREEAISVLRLWLLESLCTIGAPNEFEEQAAFLAWANKEYDVGEGYELNETNYDVMENRKGWMARAGMEPPK